MQSFASFLLLTITSLATAQPFPFRYNFGATADFTDPEAGELWKPDPFQTGTSVGGNCAAFSWTKQDQLYCNRKEWTSQKTTGKLEFPVPQGAYTIEVYFAEQDASLDNALLTCTLKTSSPKKTWTSLQKQGTLQLTTLSR